MTGTSRDLSQVIAIDGPGGSGKSTVSRAVAHLFGIAHLDTGAFYRAAALAVVESGVDPGEADAVRAALEGIVIEQRADATFLDGRDVSRDIRSPAVTAASSRVSAYAAVRHSLVERQRSWVAEHGGRAVVEGRDIGTVVFPSARLKVFLTADPVVRSRRRAAQSGVDATAVYRDLRQRDRADSTRTTSPLVPAADAVTIDTTDLAVDQVVEAVAGLAQRAGFVRVVT